MLVLHDLQCSPLALPNFSVDDFGNEIQTRRHAVCDNDISISQETWEHLFDLYQHIAACKEVAP